jgi:CubicO group peptidase (beta-lactamase class C family)
MDLTARLDRTVDRALSENRIVGSMTLVARHGEIVYSRAAGFFDREAGTPMQADAIFRLASVTKPIVAAMALAMTERGLIGLDHAISDYLPYFRTTLADGSPARIDIRHLLTHTSGLGYSFPDDPRITGGTLNTDMGFEETFGRVARIPLAFKPGTRWQYGMSTDVLGAVVAAVHGGTLHDAVRHFIAGPLGMADTGFTVTDTARLAVPYADGPPGLRRMGDPERVVEPDGTILNFSPSRTFNPKAYLSGGAGGVATAGDILTFLEAIRTGGGPILLPQTVEMATSNQIGDVPMENRPGFGFGFLGAVLKDPAAAAGPQARGTIRWGGVYGHDWSIDPANGLTIVSMTNTAAEGCHGAFPKQVRNAVYDWQPA